MIFLSEDKNRVTRVQIVLKDGGDSATWRLGRGAPPTPTRHAAAARLLQFSQCAACIAAAMRGLEDHLHQLEPYTSVSK